MQNPGIGRVGLVKRRATRRARAWKDRFTLRLFRLFIVFNCFHELAEKCSVLDTFLAKQKVS